MRKLDKFFYCLMKNCRIVVCRRRPITSQSRRWSGPSEGKACFSLLTQITIGNAQTSLSHWTMNQYGRFIIISISPAACRDSITTPVCQHFVQTYRDSCKWPEMKTSCPLTCKFCGKIFIHSFYLYFCILLFLRLDEIEPISFIVMIAKKS